MLSNKIKILIPIVILSIFLNFYFIENVKYIRAEEVSTIDQTIDKAALGAMSTGMVLGFNIGGNNNAINILGKIIAIVVSFIGIFFLITIIISGFKWLTAEGNEDNVSQAKQRIKNATIGILITFLAYSLVRAIITYIIPIF